jgi:DNA-directed RNA polymerase beta subunit
MSAIDFASLVFTALLSASHIVPYDNTIMIRNGYGLIEGTVKVIMGGLRNSPQTFVRAADTQTSRINSRILNSVNLIIRMIKATSGYQFDSTITTANCLEVLVHTYIYIYIYIYTHTHTYIYITL